MATISQGGGGGGASALTVVDGALGAGFTLVASTVTTIFSFNLGVGTWLLSYNILYAATPSAGGVADTWVVLGTAAGSITGGATSVMPDASNQMEGSAVAVVTVTTAGTVIIECESNQAMLVRSGSAQYAKPGASSFWAVQVA